MWFVLSVDVAEHLCTGSATSSLGAFARLNAIVGHANTHKYWLPLLVGNPEDKRMMCVKRSGWG